MDSELPEPRGWAMRWDSNALFPMTEAQPQEIATPAPRWELTWRQLISGTTSLPRNGNGRNGATRARGWALQWEGSALTERENGRELAHRGFAEPAEEGAA